jgi:hypothetical protein
MIAAIILSTASSARAQNFDGVGHSMGASVSLGGFLKTLVLPNALPVGKITSAYSYEVWDFSGARESIQGHNRASFCVSYMEFAQDLSIFDFAYGGELGKMRPVGQCPKDLSAMAGEDLVFSIAYDIGKGTKSIPIGLSFSYGFDLSVFTDKLIQNFTVNNPHKRAPSDRINRLHLHLLKYVLKKNTRSILSPFQSILLKLFVSTSLIGKKEMAKLTFPKDELDFISQIVSKKYLAFNSQLKNAFYDIRKDPGFYTCDVKDCDEIFVDFLTYSDAITNSMSDCHSVSVNAALQTNIGISLAPNMNVSIAFGYGVTATDKTFSSNLSTSALAISEFSKHRFSKHSNDCKEVGNKAPATFGKFLSLLGYGKKTSAKVDH